MSLKICENCHRELDGVAKALGLKVKGWFMHILWFLATCEICVQTKICTKCSDFLKAN